MNFLLTILLAIIIVIEVIFILHYRNRAKKIYADKFNTPCGNCFKESAYQRLQDRKNTCKTAYILCNEIPPLLYSSRRKRAIADEACKKFYTHLKDNLEKI